MSIKDSTAIQSDGTTDAPTDDRQVLDLDNAEPASVPGATVIFAPTYTLTEDGAALRYDGDVPVAAVGVYSEIDARTALGECYETADIDKAFRVGEWLSRERPTRATEIVSHAEGGVDRGEGVVTDGGRDIHCVWVTDCQDCGWERTVSEKDEASELRAKHEGVEHDDDPTWHIVDLYWEELTDGGRRHTLPQSTCDHETTETDYIERSDGQHKVIVCAECNLILEDCGVPQPDVCTDGGTVTLHPCSTCDGQAEAESEPEA